MKITGAELIARSLIANGITHAFNVPGLGIHPLLGALKSHSDKINYFSAPNETGVSLMADGYGRATGKPAFVNVYHASGTALGLMGVTTAWGDRSPMIFTSTTSSRKLERRDQYASVPRDITEMTRQYCKWSWEVPLVERIPEAIARAVVMATTPPMGPVHLGFPMDLYTEEIELDAAEAALLARPERLRVYNAGGADPAGIAAAAELLARAKRPLIIAGGEVAQYRAIETLVQIAESLGAAVLGEPYVAYLGFPYDHPQFAGRFAPRNPLSQQADVILVVGTEFSDPGGAVPPLPPDSAKVICLATEALDIGKQIWADVGLIGHPKTSLAMLRDSLAALGKPAERTDWRSETARVRSENQAVIETEKRRGWDDSPVHLPRLIHETRKVFPDAVIMDHSTTGAAYLLQMCDYPDPYDYFGISARASAQGWGVPAAMGMQIGLPNKRVVAFVGDGGFMFTSAALQAAAQWKLPLVVIVIGNGGWHDVAYGARKNRGWSEDDVKSYGWVLDPVIDYAGLAKSLGLRSLRVDTPAQLPGALIEARDDRSPILLEVRCDPEAVAYYLSYLAR